MIQKNDEYIIEITDLGMDGEGIGKIFSAGTPDACGGMEEPRGSVDREK